MLPGYRNGHKARKVIALEKREKGDCAANRANRVDARRGLGRPDRPRIPILLGLVIALALLAGLAPAARASSSARSPAGDRYIAYNDDLGDYTCLQTTDQQDANGFRVTTFKQDVTKRVGASPNIDYYAAYDIWFNKTDPPDPWELGENNGADLMIWLVNHQPPQGTGNYKIDGHSWTMMKWTAGNSQTKTTWRYIAFITTPNLTTAALRLNPFFKEAIRLGSLSPSWSLTNIAFGFEMRGGDLAGLAVNSFSVQDVRSGGADRLIPGDRVVSHDGRRGRAPRNTGTRTIRDPVKAL
jgi:Glycosyl hydrolase family 12